MPENDHKAHPQIDTTIGDRNKNIQNESEYLKKIRDSLIQGHDIWDPEKIKKDNIKQDQNKERDERYRQLKEWLEKASRNHYEQPDPLDKLRAEVMTEIEEIKDAIRKIGILLDSDAPSEETLEKYKTLKKAYEHYKMIEALTLGGEDNGEEDHG